MALTDTLIRPLRPSKRPYRKTDSGGLILEVKPSGARLWRYRYRIAGKENMFAIGAYPEISLKEAREARDEARKLVKEGIHPAHHRKAERLRKAHENANTFEAVAREWLDSNKSHWTPRTYRQRLNLLCNGSLKIYRSLTRHQAGGKTGGFDAFDDRSTSGTATIPTAQHREHDRRGRPEQPQD